MAEANSAKDPEITMEVEKPEEAGYIVPVGIYAIKPNGRIPARFGFESNMIVLSSAKRVLISPRSWEVVPFGIKIALPRHAHGRIEIRPVLAQNYGLFIAGGVLEPGDYEEVKATVFNHSHLLSYEVEAGEEIAYLIIEAVYQPCIWTLVEEPFYADKKQIEIVGKAIVKREQMEMQTM